MSGIFLKLVADGFIIPVVIIGGWVLLFKVPKAERYAAYCRVLMAGMTAFLVAQLIASIYQPELMRPFEVLGKTAGASFLNNPGFPSDHTLLCMTITLAVWFETRMKKVALVLLLLTVAVGVGRVLALVHTPLDVTGGIIIACAGIPWYLQRDINTKHILAESRIKHKNGVQ